MIYRKWRNGDNEMKQKTKWKQQTRSLDVWQENGKEKMMVWLVGFYGISTFVAKSTFM